MKVITFVFILPIFAPFCFIWRRETSLRNDLNKNAAKLFFRTQRSQMLGHLRNVSGWKMITVKSTLLILNANFFRSLSFYLSLSLSLSLSLNVSLSLSLSLSQSHLLSPFVQLSFSLSVSYSFCSVSSRFSLSLSHAQYLLSTHSKNLTLPSYFQMFLSFFANTSTRTHTHFLLSALSLSLSHTRRTQIF